MSILLESDPIVGLPRKSLKIRRHASDARITKYLTVRRTRGLLKYVAVRRMRVLLKKEIIGQNESSAGMLLAELY